MVTSCRHRALVDAGQDRRSEIERMVPAAGGDQQANSGVVRDKVLTKGAEGGGRTPRHWLVWGNSRGRQVLLPCHALVLSDGFGTIVGFLLYPLALRDSIQMPQLPLEIRFGTVRCCRPFRSDRRGYPSVTGVSPHCAVRSDRQRHIHQPLSRPSRSPAVAIPSRASVSSRR